QQAIGVVIPIDSTQNYRLRMEIRGTGEEGATFWPILEQSDSKHLPISAFQLNAVTGTETSLLRDARAGETELLVADASKWQPPEQGKILAFNAASDLTDLPNRNIEYYLQKISEVDGKWLLTMSRPLQRAWSAGTMLRQHRDGGYMTFGLSPVNLTSDWQQMEGFAFAAPASGGPITNLWRGVAFAQLKCIAPKGVEIQNLTFEELGAEAAERLLNRRSLRGRMLQSTIRVQNSLKTLPNAEALVVEVEGDAQSAFYQMDAMWPASQVKQVEFSAMARQPGFFRFIGRIRHADGSSQEIHCPPQMAIPDGEFHPFVFETPQVDDSKSLVTNWELRWFGAPGVVGLASIEVQDEANLILDAHHLPVAKALPMNALKPHARYRLEWKGERSPGITFRFYDNKLQEFPGTALQLPAGEKVLRFTTPDMLIQAQMTMQGTGSGHPVLTLEEYHFPFAPYGHWRGKWIWDRPLDTGPYSGLVWFQRDFELPDNIEYGAVACLADDNAEWFVNGKRVGRSVIWTTPTRWEITEFLKPGKNRITVRVWNGTMAGGLAADVYARANGQDFYLDTDNQWTCAEE
ncbi:MAG: hypothetical protein IJT83_09545, partial [Victivallales bacterium]|nr:hypothetical protein [Victivallales bacterium]